MTDEFNGVALDSAKWANPGWGYPAMATNAVVKDGSLRIMVPKDPSMFQTTNNAVAAVVLSRKAVIYGYFEIRARVAACAACSAFWFSSGQWEVPTWWRNELDVFEQTGKSAKVDPGVYNMAMHTASGPDGNHMPTAAGYWKAPWNFADDFHIYGVQWDPDWVRYYVDGVLVHEVENALKHAPQWLMFYADVKPDWFGLPREEDLPSTFSIDYVRAWKRIR
jgi:beta-glucanase (GH16 family)